MYRKEQKYFNGSENLNSSVSLLSCILYDKKSNS